MVAVEARRRALERFSAEPEALRERRRLADLAPAPRLGGDAGADGVQDVAVGVPEAARHEDAVRFQIEIEAGSVDVARLRVAELDADVRLVRRLVLGEPHVAVDAEQRAAGGTG